MSEEKEPNFIFWVLIALGISAIVIGAYFLNFKDYSVSSDTSVWGTFGDYVGGVLNPILALLTFVLLLKTIIFQSHELKLTRKQAEQSNIQLEHSAKQTELSAKELELTRKQAEISAKELELTRLEMAKSAESLKDQNKVMKVQLFETTYFNILQKYESYLSSLLDNGTKRYTDVNSYLRYLNKEYKKRKDFLPIIVDSLYRPLLLLASLNILIKSEFPDNKEAQAKYFGIAACSMSLEEINIYESIHEDKSEFVQLTDLSYLKDFTHRGSKN